LSVSERIPPMTWIRAFFETARQQTFKAAAAALHVSPSTISHEVRSLENFLSILLFDRSKRKIRLTDEGQQLYSSLQPVFAQLDVAFNQFQNVPNSSLRLGVLAFVSSEFLLPRMQNIEKVLDEISLELSPNNQLESLNSVKPDDRLDAVIRYSASPSPGYENIELTKIKLALVECMTGSTSVKIQKGDSPPKQKRIVVDGPFNGWKRFQDAGLLNRDCFLSEVKVDTYISALRAVQHGLGVGIAVLPLSGSWMDENRIKFYDQKAIVIAERYWLVYRRESPHAAKLVLLGNWLSKEFAVATA